MAVPDRLPAEATDDGERIVVAPDRGTRLWAAGAAILGLTLSMGAGGRRGRGLRRDQPFVVLRVEHQASGPDLTMELNRSDIAQGEALLATLSDRGWLPDNVTVTVDADR